MPLSIKPAASTNRLMSLTHSHQDLQSIIKTALA